MSFSWPEFLFVVAGLPGILPAQQACPPETFQITASANLVPSASSYQVLLRQDDRSYTAYEITNTAPYQVLNTLPNFQRQLRACPMTTPPGANVPEAFFSRLPSGEYLLITSFNAFDSPVTNFDVTAFDRSLNQVSHEQYVIPVQDEFQEATAPLLVTDLNHDGNPDLVLKQCLHLGSLFVGCNVGVMLGTGGTGFQQPVFYPMGSSFEIPMPSSFETAIAAADVNGDGNVDLVVATTPDPNQEFTGEISVFLGKGDGSFQSQKVAWSGPYVAGLAVADLNQDGKPDLVFSTASSTGAGLSVALGAGNGTFSTPVSYSVAATEANLGLAVAIGDLDGDGYQDIVVNGLSILFGDGKGGFPRRRDYAAGNPSAADVVLTDFDGDGITDIVIAAGDSQILYPSPFDASIEVLFGRGNGEFAAPPLSLIPGSNQLGNYASAIAAADFDGDGILDLVTAQTNAVSVLKGLGDGTFNTVKQYQIPKGVTQLAIGDFNRDGKLDFAAVAGDSNTGLAMFLGNGDGTFQAPIGIPVAAGSNSLAAGDFNGDGIPDLAVVSFADAFDSSVQILLGNGFGTFYAGAQYAAGPGPRAVVAADFNGDGQLDLAIANAGAWSLPFQMLNGNVTILLGKGDGTFSSGTVLPLTPASGPNDLVAADFNRDGRMDLAVAQGDSLAVVLGNGDGTFGPAATYPVNATTVLAVDMNRDSLPDLVVSGGILIGNGDGSFQPVVYVNGLGFAAPGDFNGDGRLDFATLVPSGVATFLNISGTQATLAVVSAASLESGAVAPESLATIFGANLANSTEGTGTLPVVLAGTSVFIQDSAGVIRPAPLLYVSPQQVNFLVPSGTSTGPSTVTVWNGTVPQSVRQLVAPVAPSLFMLNASGLAAAYVDRVAAGGTQTIEPVFTLQNGTPVARPISLGSPAEQVYLILFGTGIRQAGTGQTSVTVKGLAAPVTYAGPQPQFAGLDQVNVLLPKALAGSGDVIVLLTAQGADANPVHLSIR